MVCIYGYVGIPSMIDTALRAAQISGWSALLVLPDSGQSIAIWGLLITSVATLLKQFLDKRDARLDRDQQHKFEQDASDARLKLQNSMNENTLLTRAASAQLDRATNRVTLQMEEVGVKADKAYEAGNNVGQKFARLAEAALAGGTIALAEDRATEKISTAAIRNDIAEVRDEANQRDK